LIAMMAGKPQAVLPHTSKRQMSVGPAILSQRGNLQNSITIWRLTSAIVSLAIAATDHLL
jgi:hypothetical protein